MVQHVKCRTRLLDYFSDAAVTTGHCSNASALQQIQLMYDCPAKAVSWLPLYSVNSNLHAYITSACVLQAVAGLTSAAAATVATCLPGPKICSSSYPWPTRISSRSMGWHR
eukprot:GHRR01011750.1.p1 GENE.GHRR01011750.1~~GHRR01011750.1.p1  ORF type:complete len:111 (-),score=22.90 GHRR01011750.1:1877-2209(-)